MTHSNVRVRFCPHCKKKTKQRFVETKLKSGFVCRTCLKAEDDTVATGAVNDATLRVVVREEKGSRRLSGFPTYSVHVAGAEDDGFFFVTEKQPEDAAKAIARGMELLIERPEGRKMLAYYYERECGKEVAVAQ